MKQPGREIRSRRGERERENIIKCTKGNGGREKERDRERDVLICG